MLDRDKDRKMTPAEFDLSGARAFTEQDSDKDGIVTQTDVDAAAARQHGAR